MMPTTLRAKMAKIKVPIFDMNYVAHRMTRDKVRSFTVRDTDVAAALKVLGKRWDAVRIATGGTHCSIYETGPS